ncbi:excinuclease ABC subunit UvrB [bacterium]|nr:excinuclease ABC subunit UvrB [Chlamydiota bacterium]NDD98998.1 excinuclease ABC subunit UvrB [bacterium]
MTVDQFLLRSVYEPKGDQPHAIKYLTQGIKEGVDAQVLLGITGSGKTFTMANVIQNVQKPTLVLAHNKTLAAQLYQEFKTFFPHNAVEYFVSYYDYYQPEAYIARTDTYIEKDLAINDRIERMRLSATKSLIERKDVIIVSSVSCIYGIGAPDYFARMQLKLQVGMKIERDDLLLKLVEIHYKRNDLELTRSKFRVRGDVVEVALAYEENIAVRVELFGDEIERLSLIDPLTARIIKREEKVTIFPGSHYVMPEEVKEDAIELIKKELEERRVFYLENQRPLEEHRIRERTLYDLELIREIGFCKGIENYSRAFSNRKPGDPPSCLLDYFPADFLLFVDESHQTVPQIGAMRNGDKARKVPLIEFGFRLPSAFDNRPLSFDEFREKVQNIIYVSATPGPYELEDAEGRVAEQIIRPTGLLDPVIEVKPAMYQVDDAIGEIQKEIEKGNRILVTTLTKKLAEDLTKYMKEIGIKTQYLHSDIDTLERVKIIKQLRVKEIDVLVGINLLREGLDIPEVSLVLILDADKEGFLRSKTSLIQTCGRAARNKEGRVVMYADTMTKSIQETIEITQNRRKLQENYNLEHGIEPQSVLRETTQTLKETFFQELETEIEEVEKEVSLSPKELERKIKLVEKEMLLKAKALDFAAAILLRDELERLKNIAMQQNGFD